MKLRRYFFIILSLLFIFSSLPINNSLKLIPTTDSHVYAEGTVTIYAPDGRCATVYESEAETYFSLGWYRTFEEVTKTIYAPDGSSIRIYIQDLPSYLALGWYDSFDKITSTLYATDGRQVTVYNADVPSYLALGWYSSYEDVTVKLYAPDGRTITVYKDEAYTYLNWGWYSTIEEVTKRLIKPGGGEITVYLTEVDKYIADGWILPGKADPSKPMVALSFDDGPSPYYTRRIVDTLVKHGACATFFSVGEYVQKYPGVTKYVYDNGMETANHTYTHPELTKISSAAVKKEIENTSAEIKIATGNAPKLLRPPYGSVNANVKQISNLPMILWSIDTEDWKSRNANTIYSRVAGKVKDGDIILMHDLYESTADAVDRIVPYLIENGFQIVSVSTLAECKGYTLTPGQTYRSMK